MALRDRCDQIVRLIDESLMPPGAEPGPVIDVSRHPSGASLVSQRPGCLEPADLAAESTEGRGDAGGGGGHRGRRHRSVTGLRALHDDGIADL
jgi:hypothetical protein